MIAPAEDDCVCRKCGLQRAAGDVAARVANLPHQDLTELVILRHFAPSVFLDGAIAPRVSFRCRGSSEYGRGFHRTVVHAGGCCELALRTQLGDLALLLHRGAA